jgi:hypothetical protein
MNVSALNLNAPSQTMPFQKNRTGFLGIALGTALTAIIAGTVVAGPQVAFISIIPLVIAVLAFALRSPTLGICIYFGYSAIEGMYKYLSHFSQVVYAIKPVLAVMLLLIWLITLHFSKSRFRFPPLSLLIVLLAGWGFVMIFSPTGAGVASSLITLAVWYLVPIVFYIIASNAFKSAQQIETLCYVLVAVCTVVSVFAIIQYTMGQVWTDSHLPGYSEITQHNWWTLNDKGQVDQKTWSPASCTTFCGAAAIWAHIGAIVSMGLMLSPKTPQRYKIPLAACLLLNSLGLLIIGVRLWVVVLILETILLLVMTARTREQLKRNISYLFVLGAMAGISFVIAQSVSGGMISGRYGSTLADPAAKFQHDRGGNMSYLPGFLLKNPLGVGYQRGLNGGTADDSSSDMSAINRETQFNSAAADLGTPGLLLIILLLMGVLYQGWRAFRYLNDPQLRVLGATLFVLIVGNIVASFGTPTLQGDDYFWTVAGALVALPVIQKSQRIPEQASRQKSNYENRFNKRFPAE